MKNKVIDNILYNESLNKNCNQIVKLGNGKTFILDKTTDFCDNDFKFDKNNLPNDLDIIGLKTDDNWATYTFCKSLAIDDAIFDFEGGSTYYYKKAGVIVATYCGEIKCTDAQLVKVLTDDYKHRLIKTLSKVSDDSICEYYENEVAKYKMRNK